MAKKPHCDDCGEEEKLHRLKIDLDGKTVKRWRLCMCCAAIKIAAAHRQTLSAE